MAGEQERDPERIDAVLDALRDAWRLYPELRLGQLLLDAKMLTGHGGSDDLYHYEDDDLLEALIDVRSREPR